MDNIIEPILSVLSLIVFSLIIRFILQLAKQTWITTFTHTVTIFFLPIITFFVTKVISGNIALSLGMVGALSIVRFRNPVRSPLELTVYFTCITMGVAASVHLRWLLYMLLAIFVTSLSLFIITKISKFFGKTFYNISFTEGNPLSVLEINSNRDIDLLDNSIFLASKIKNDNEIIYELTSTDFKDLKIILAKVNKDNKLNNYQIRFNQ
tara:strand:- start:164 stop:790 length:627 start_codon:yes stop_codon:yes gene_type:complete